MILKDVEEIGSRKVQRAKAIEVGIINPNVAPILIAENGCIAFDMNVCKPEVLRAVADMLEGKKKPAGGSVAKKKVTKKVAK